LRHWSGTHVPVDGERRPDGCDSALDGSELAEIFIFAVALNLRARRGDAG
jgi:hypothetical protein